MWSTSKKQVSSKATKKPSLTSRRCRSYKRQGEPYICEYSLFIMHQTRLSAECSVYAIAFNPAPLRWLTWSSIRAFKCGTIKIIIIIIAHAFFQRAEAITGIVWSIIDFRNLLAKKQSYPSLQKTNWWLLTNQSWCKHWKNSPLMKKCYTFLWKAWRHITRFVKESTRSHWLKPDCNHQWFY